jgi:hypothetical protein
MRPVWHRPGRFQRAGASAARGRLADRTGAFLIGLSTSCRTRTRPDGFIESGGQGDAGAHRRLSRKMSL